MKNNMAIKELITKFVGQANTLTIPREFISLTGDVIAALLLSQIIYWSDRHNNNDGWFAKSYDDWAEELGLTKYQVTRAIKVLADWNVETKVAKSQYYKYAPTVHYRIDMVAFTSALIATMRPTSSIESEEPELSESQEPELSLYTETTTETTTDSAPTSRPQLDEPKTPALWRISEYHDLVCDAFVVSGYALGRKIAQVLSCEYKKRDAWKDAQPPTPISLEEMRDFVKWYKAKSEAKHRGLRDPVKIQDVVCEYRAHAAKQAASAERAAAQREQARVEEEAFTPMTDEERRAVEARYADEMRGLGRRVGTIGAAS